MIASVPLTRRRPLIGISGYAATGKTAAAFFIESEHGYTRQHIAEPLRRMLASLLREYGLTEVMIERYLVGDLKEEVIPEIGVTSRHLQITLGTEWGRQEVDPDLWAKLWVRQGHASGGARMNDSVRFPNEEDSIRDGGGFTMLIERPGTGPRAFKWPRWGPRLYRWFGCMWGVHDSERTDRLRPDFIVVNDGTLEDLHRKIDEVMRDTRLMGTSPRPRHRVATVVV